MTLNEFRAWLDGFSAAMGDAPTPQQWAAVKEKLATVETLPFVQSPIGYPSVFGPAPRSYPGSAGDPPYALPLYTTC